ncbi:MAG: F0F1 ATP synthase subunit A [Alphaproteobacteria bacterium]|nr:MAG: F0F1 ATP synthase subunit A [Alphaproteobacteria bacterium]
MHQFVINKIADFQIGGLDLSFTNSSLWMVAAVATVSLFMMSAMSGRALIPGRMQSVAELCYEFISNMVRDNAGTEGMKFFPFVFTVFTFVLSCNMLGMIPYSFTVTSHIIVTFALAAVIITIVLVYGLLRNGFKFFGLFLPSGVPWWMAPIMVPIEVISFLSRPISLSVRLFANMLAGHTVLKVFAGFVVSIGSVGGLAMLGAIVPLAMATALIGLEFLVAFLQAFIFSILTCIYLNDAIHPSH